MGAKKKEEVEEVIVKGVRKVFNETPRERMYKNIKSMNKQLNLNLNRLEMISDHLTEIEIYEMMDELIATVRFVSQRAMSIRNNKLADITREENINEREESTTGKD